MNIKNMVQSLSVRVLRIDEEIKGALEIEDLPPKRKQLDRLQGKLDLINHILSDLYDNMTPKEKDRYDPLYAKGFREIRFSLDKITAFWIEDQGRI